MDRRPGRPVWLHGLLVISASFACSFAPTDVLAQEYRVETDVPGTPRMTPLEVHDTLVNSMARPIQGVTVNSQNEREIVPKPPEVVGMKCIPGSALGISSFPYGKPEEAYEPERIWIVQAKMSVRLPGTPGEAIEANEGYLIIDDANGEILARGTGSIPIGPAPSD